MAELIAKAVAQYWSTLDTQSSKQNDAGKADRGRRGAVTGGKQMDGFCQLLAAVATASGMTQACIHTRAKLEIPGYFRPTKRWDMEVLGALLSSRVALFFVWSYAVKTRGGYLRFQAQYLRRIRVPAPSSISARTAGALAAAFRARDFARIDELALAAYELKSLPEFDFVDTRR